MDKAKYVIHIFNEKLLKDLRSKDFKIISRNRFYAAQSTKNKLREYLKNIRNTYKLKESLTEKQIIDSLKEVSFLTK